MTASCRICTKLRRSLVSLIAFFLGVVPFSCGDKFHNETDSVLAKAAKQKDVALERSKSVQGKCVVLPVILASGGKEKVRVARSFPPLGRLPILFNNTSLDYGSLPFFSPCKNRGYTIIFWHVVIFDIFHFEILFWLPRKF
jgi:hypothetical protein